MKISLANKVWNVIISPKDRTLKDELNLYANVNKIEMKLYEVSDGDQKSSYCSKYYLAKYSGSPKTTSNEKRKLLVVFPGRNFNFFQIGNGFYAQKFYKTSKLDEFDIATIIYPAKTRNLNQLTNTCELAIEQLIKIHGYSVANMSIFGWCLGGYFATETLCKFAELNKEITDTFQCFINNKSFSSIHDFLYYILPKYLRPLLKVCVIKRYVRKWNNDSSRSLEQFEAFFKSIYVVFSDEDNIINGLSHFYKHVGESENVKICEDVERANHLINWNLLANLIETTNGQNK